MGDTGGVRRLRQPRLLRRDWVGDAILTIVAGLALLAAVFLPWANEDAPGWVNFSPSRAEGFNAALQTQWGLPALCLAVAVVALGMAMLLTRPRRLSFVLGLAVAACGLAVFAVAQDAAAHIGYLDPGLGMFVTTLTGVLLVPIGLAAALVARFLTRPAATAPPAPESAPPS
jgi:hypothetical protein